jgi:hypothetical protein
MTQELVRQRRAALDAEPRNQRLVRHIHPARAGPERGRFAVAAQTLARQVRALVARAAA